MYAHVIFIELRKSITKEGADLRLDIGEIFRIHRNEIYTYLIYFTGRTDVEDLVQETFIRAIKGIHGYRQLASVKTWLYAIARNVAIDEKRRKKLLITDVELDNLPLNGYSLEQRVETRETTYRILNLLGAVNHKYRDVLILRGIHELSSQEAADILGWTPVRVNVTYHRALKTARKLIVIDIEGEEEHDAIQ